MISKILGNKIGMTQFFTAEGQRIPATVIKVGPCFITQIKTIEKEGYNAIQIGYQNPFSTKKLKYPEYKHLEKIKALPFLTLNTLEELRVENSKTYIEGDIIDLKEFTKGTFITVSGKSIGKGTAGNIKRHHFKRGPMSHGSKHHRLQGSLGAGTTPGRVFPGKKMSGRLGFSKCTIKNLEILENNLKENILVVKGSIPGKFGNLISIIKN